MDATNLIVYLPFNESVTQDLLGGTWTAYGSPTIGTANAFNGNALQLDGASYIQSDIVRLFSRADVFIDGVADRKKYIMRFHKINHGIGIEHLSQTFFGKQFMCLVHRLCYSVGVQKDRIARIKINRSR